MRIGRITKCKPHFDGHIWLQLYHWDCPHCSYKTSGYRNEVATARDEHLGIHGAFAPDTETPQ